MANFRKSDVEQMLSEVDGAIEVLFKNEAGAMKEASANADSDLQKAATMEKCGDPTAAAPLKKDEPSASVPPEATDASATAPDASAPPAPEASDSSAAAAPPMDPAAATGQQMMPTVDELKAEYGQLSPAELKVHAEALAQVMSAQQGAGAPPDQSAAPAAPPPAAGDATLPGEGSPGVQPESEMAMKSEKLEAEVADLKKSMEAMTAVLKQAFTPKQKAVTGLDTVPAATQTPVRLNKSEVNAKIAKLDKSNLTKSEFSAIKDFYAGKAGVDSIAHLIK